MKKILFSVFVLFAISLTVHCQSSEGFKYQAVIRDANNLILNNQTFGMRFRIQQGNIGGSIIYSETFVTTSNNYGLVNLEIGSGTTSDDFTIIDWANGPYFLEVSVDFLSSGQWSVMGNSQLMSVPYAFHSKTADSILGGIAGLEIDPIFSSSIASTITAADTSYWNSFIDTQLDSTGIASLGYVAGPHTVNTDTQLDSIGIASFGYVAGPHTVDTDTQIDSIGIANFGYVAGPRTIDTQIDSIGIANFGYFTGPHTIDTQIDSIGIANFGYVAEKPYSIGMWPELGGYVFRTSSDGKHGLVAEVQDQSSSAVMWYGADNLINNPANHSVDAQKFCNWRMPSKEELNEMYLQRFAIGGNFNLTYWSSTEFSQPKAYSINFSISGNGAHSTDNKLAPVNYVRGVREF